MHNIRRVLLVIMMSMLPMSAHAEPAPTEHTEMSLLADAGEIRPGQPLHVMVRVKLESGWHTYWKNAGDSGVPPQLEWTLPRGFTAGETQFLAPDRLVTGGLVDFGYHDEADYLVTITPPAAVSQNTTAILSLNVSVLVCKDVCIPEKAKLSLALPVRENAQSQPTADEMLVAQKWQQIPAPFTPDVAYTLSGSQVKFDVPVDAVVAPLIQDAAFFPESDGFITNADQQQVRVAKDAVTFILHKADGTAPEHVKGLVSLYLKNGERNNRVVSLTNNAPSVATAHAADPESGFAATLLAMLCAFAGGIILNLMPCVFPILSIKALAIAKQAAQHPKEVRAHGFAYAAGVIASFLALAGVLVLLQSGGRAVGWGYQMQSPPFVLFLVVLLAGVGFNLSGLFEFPSLNFSGKPQAEEGWLGGFLSGVLAVLVATPCTAPFMASAVGYAFAQPLGVIFLVFVSLGLGLALPFLLLSLFPALTQKLPKPGAWMLTLRQALAFPMYLAAIWLYWVFMREAGPDAAALVLVAVVLAVCALWLGGHAPQQKVIRLLIWLCSVIALWGACTLTMQPAQSVAADQFSVARLEALRAEGKPVLVDATADWCITCKVNEHLILKNNAIQQLFAQHNVTMMVADWTHGDMDITRYLATFNRRGVPLYVYYAPHKEGVVLPQVLTESVIKEAIEQ